MGNGLLAVRDAHRLAINKDLPLPAPRPDAEQALYRLGTSGADQPGEADDLPGADLQIEIDKAFSGKLLHPQHGKILRLGAAVARQRQPQLLRVAQRMVAAGRRHSANQLLIAVSCGLAAQHYRPVAHHRNMTGKLADFGQFVRDKHDPHVQRL